MFRLALIILAVGFAFGPAFGQPAPAPEPVQNFPEKSQGCRGIAFSPVKMAAINSTLRAQKSDQEIYEIPGSPGRYALQFGTIKRLNPDGSIRVTEPMEREIKPGDYIYWIDEDSVRVRTKTKFEEKCQVSP